MLLKINFNGEIQFVDSRDQDYFALGKKDKFPFDKDDAIEFVNLNGKWYVKNNTTIKIKYGFFKLKPLGMTKLKYDKQLITSNLKIEMIRVLKHNRGLETIEAGHANASIDLTKQTEYFIGRSKLCDIIVDNPQIDEKNTRIVYHDEKCFIEDLRSSNGMIINGKRMHSKELENYDVIELPSAYFTYFDHKLIYSTSNKGMRIDICNVSKRVKDSRTSAPILLLNNISFKIGDGEFVAIVGGSGAGKSTILDAINGRRPQTGGKIYYDYNNYYDFIPCYQKIIGYVPQRDIMHSELTVMKSLYYYCQIRMQHNLNKKEIIDLCEKALKDVSLYDKKDLKISKLSGGQRKRVSIAMELLSNPRVIFLDEPTSGLSPDLDYDIMLLLQKLSKEQGKTVVVITHNMENVDMCDKIAFLGNGGRLCYFGKPDNIFEFFDVEKYGQIFSMLTIKENVLKYEEKLHKQSDYIKLLNEQQKLYKEAVTYVSIETNSEKA